MRILTPVLTPVASQSESLFHRPSTMQWLQWCVAQSGTVTWSKALFQNAQADWSVYHWFITGWKQLIFFRQLAEWQHDVSQARLLQLWADRGLHGKVSMWRVQYMMARWPLHFLGCCSASAGLEFYAPVTKTKEGGVKMIWEIILLVT